MFLRDWKLLVENHGYKYLRTDKSNIYYSKDGWDFFCNKYRFPPKKIAINNCLTPEPYIISLMRDKHNNKYGYDKFSWTGCVADYSTFHCHEHGYFDQIINNHLKGYGCFECNGSKKLILDDIRMRCEDFRGDDYDYSDLKYDHASNKITIKCREHGEFSTNLYSHLKGSDCYKCYLKTKIGTSLSNSDFIEKSKAVHGDKYDYSKVDYIGAKKEVIIGCDKHGYFNQVANYHLSGNGCPECGLMCTGFSKTSYIRACPDGSNIYVFEICADDEKFVKVGISKNIKNRIRMITHESKYTVEIIYEKFVNDTSFLFDLERLTHREFSDFKYVPNLPFSGRTECYDYKKKDDIINYLDISLG